MTTATGPHVGTPCPGCGSRHLVQVTPTWANLLCRTCGTCWRPVSDGFERVHADRCPGCPEASFCRVVNGLAAPTEVAASA